MRPGLFPSQQRALRQAFKKADKFDHFRQRTRRAFLGLGALALGMGAGGLALGRSGRVPQIAADLKANAGPPHLPEPLLDIVTGPLENLRTEAMNVAAALEAAPHDSVLWIGFHRLVALALNRPEDDLLRRRLRTVAALPGMPTHATEASRLLTRPGK